MVHYSSRHMPKNWDALHGETDVQIGSRSNRRESLSAECCLAIHRHMLRARMLEERLIQMTKAGTAVFWVGGPGEEAFNVCLGMHVKKGCGPSFDYLHLHYRNSALLMPMGLDLIEPARQILCKRSDVNSMGRNFVSHYARRHANVIPVTSVVEVQYVMAPGTALMQKRQQDSDGVSFVIGGDAGAAEGDFASCMNWSTREGQELPVLMIVTNNNWGISTCHKTQYGNRSFTDLAAGYGIAAEVVDGNDPVASWHAIERALDVCRKQRKPYLLEAQVSRLYGHSSASGANRFDEPDCLTMFQQRLIEAGVLEQDDIDQLRKETTKEIDEAIARAMTEPDPTPGDLYEHTYAPSTVDKVYPEDYTGLPEA